MSHAKIETPLMLTPLLPLGPGRLGITDLEAEALNNGVCLRGDFGAGALTQHSAALGRRRRSIAELEARVEVGRVVGVLLTTWPKHGLQAVYCLIGYCLTSGYSLFGHA